MLKFLVADDHPLFRSALKDVLHSIDAQCEILEASNFKEAEDKANKDLDAIFLDLMMPDASGFSALIALRSHVPSVPIVIVSANDEGTTISDAAAFGAAGYIPKSIPEIEIGKAVNQILDGDHFWPQPRSTCVPANQATNGSSPGLEHLTPSELGVLNLMSKGRANKIIAYELDIKESTVKSHITAILRKMKVNNRTQAVLLARQLREEGEQQN